MTTRAEQLGISEGPLWIIGHSDEENSLLDPIADNIDFIIDGEDDEDGEDGDSAPDDVEAAIVVVDDPETLEDDLDDALPRVGAVPIVWVALPRNDRDLTVASVTEAIDEYGWSASDRVDLGSAWTALRVTPA